MRALVLSALIAAPSFADVTATYPDDALAVVTLENEPTLGGVDDGDYEIQTELGPVIIRQTSTPNGPNSCCPDRFEVIDLPEGVMAHPSVIDVEENDSGQIIVRRFVGM